MPIARLAATLATVVALSACTDDPCVEYVDYMCDCEVDAEGCDELRTAYEDAAPELQDECTIALDDEQEAAAETGEECGAEDTGGGA